jgi:hypothetical protein
MPTKNTKSIIKKAAPILPGTTVALAKVFCGILPWPAGSLLAEAIGLGWSRIQAKRLEDFQRKVLAGISENDLTQALEDPDVGDLLEDSLRQAVRAQTEKRRAHIAELFCRSLGEKELRAVQYKRLLRTLGDLDDAEILILKTYALSGKEQIDFMRKHQHVVSRPIVELGGSPDSDPEARAVYDSQVAHLRQLTLIHQEDLRLVKEVGEGPGSGPITVTPYGMLLLGCIGEIEYPGRPE